MRRPAEEERADAPAVGLLDRVGEVSAAVESGAGLPEVARAVGRALAASVVVIDAASSVLAVASASSADERALLAGREGTRTVELRVADAAVGELRFRPADEDPPQALLRMVATLLAVEVERSRAPERASDAAVVDLLADLTNRRVTDRENIVARGTELGADLSSGGTVLVVRARPQLPEAGDWRARVLSLAERGARAVERSALIGFVPLALGRAGRAAANDDDKAREDELVVLLPGFDSALAERAAGSVRRELEAGLSGYSLIVAQSRPASDPTDLHRAGTEALLAANVAEAQGDSALAFEDTGAYRLLLPAMSEDPLELQSFYEETVAPLVAYDEQYETELLRTLETFLDVDGSVAKASERLFTHRHTIRYRLERARELTGLDVGSSDGRERLSLGLKAMRVLGIAPPHGPATERGAEGGRVPKEQKDR
jgi:sugar diacid utilization regulator